jgi:hypothetical protein
MVLARRPRETALRIDHREHHHRTVLPPRLAATPRTVVRPVVLRETLEPAAGRRGAHGPRGAAGPPGRASGARRVAGPRAAVPALAPAARAAPAVAVPVPAVTAVARAAARELAETHRRVETHAPPRLRALPVEPRAPEASGAAAPPRPRAVPVPAREPALEMVVRRSAAAVASAAAQAAVAAAAAAPGRELVSRHHPAPAPALDLDSLADRVVAQIDRRVVAHRERLGKI